MNENILKLSMQRNILVVLGIKLLVCIRTIATEVPTKSPLHCTTLNQYDISANVVYKQRTYCQILKRDYIDSGSNWSQGNPNLYQLKLKHQITPQQYPKMIPSIIQITSHSLLQLV